MMMVQETTCGLSCQLIKGGIDDGIDDGCQIESFDNEYARWASSLPDGQLHYLDDKI